MTDTAFLIVGIILTLVGGFLACVTVKHRISCSKKITATVSSVKKTAYEKRGRTRYEYLPIFFYTVNGKMYKSKGDKTSWNRSKYEVGNEFEIRYDPKFPDRISNGVKGLALFGDFLLMIFGITLVICYFI